MVGGHGFGQLLDLACDGTVVLLEVLGMLKDAVEVFLKNKTQTEPFRANVQYKLRILPQGK